MPGRTDTGRRLYSDQDLEKLTLLGLLTGVGHRIGDIATLPLEELRALAEENSAAPAPAVRPTGEAVPASHFLEDALKAIVALDARGLENVLNQALLHLSKPILRREFLAPLLEEVGARWCDGRLRIAHEHMATAVIKTFLSGVNARYQVWLLPAARKQERSSLGLETPARKVNERRTGVTVAGRARRIVSDAYPGAPGCEG